MLTSARLLVQLCALLLLAACAAPRQEEPPPATLAAVPPPDVMPTATAAPATLTPRPSPTRRPTPPPPTAAPALDPEAAEAELVALIDARRAEAGCPQELAVSPELTAAARRHSADMAQGDFFDHTGSDGSSFVERIDAAGYRWSSAAENVGAGYATPGEVVEAWLASEEHRENMLACELRDVGVGFAERRGSRYVYYWTALFAAPR